MVKNGTEEAEPLLFQSWWCYAQCYSQGEWQSWDTPAAPRQPRTPLEALEAAVAPELGF